MWTCDSNNHTSLPLSLPPLSPYSQHKRVAVGRHYRDPQSTSRLLITAPVPIGCPRLLVQSSEHLAFLVSLNLMENLYMVPGTVSIKSLDTVPCQVNMFDLGFQEEAHLPFIQSAITHPLQTVL